MTRAKVIGGSILGVLLAATALVKPWEGYEPKPYRDIVGVLTVCYGSTTNIEQRTYSEKECSDRLNSELGAYFAGISQCIKRPLREREWAAVLSWAYNVGVGAACRSTLVRRINAGEQGPGWCEELSKWTYAGGKRVQGLISRRAAERAMCEGGQ
ncbi:MAG: lysozyme [Stenotrophomonas sp.]